MSFFRPTKVSAGHADGIQPRTIEVLQVYSFYLIFFCQSRLSSCPELWIGAKIVRRRKSNIHGCNCFSKTLLNLVLWIYFHRLSTSQGWTAELRQASTFVCVWLGVVNFQKVCWSSTGCQCVVSLISIRSSVCINWNAVPFYWGIVLGQSSPRRDWIYILGFNVHLWRRSRSANCTGFDTTIRR